MRAMAEGQSGSDEWGMVIDRKDGAAEKSSAIFAWVCCAWLSTARIKGMKRPYKRKPLGLDSCVEIAHDIS